MLGTKDFMSPEVLSSYKYENGEIDREAMLDNKPIKYTKMVDIWAMGIILYNIVYATQPFCNIPGGRNSRIRAIANPDIPVEFPMIDNLDPALVVKQYWSSTHDLS